MGVAAGAFLGDRGRILRRIARPAAVGGGAAGVAALIGNPLVGAVFMLELGRRKRVPLSLERCTAALVGGLVGWSINVAFDLSLIRLNVPEIAPEDLPQALATAVLVGLVAGAVTSLTGVAIYRARGWQAPPVLRLVLGGLAVAAAATAVAAIASPAAAVGPGTGAAVWAETADAAAPTLLAVALLRAAATTAAVAAGGCGGLFVPFLAIGDVAGRALAPTFGVPSDLAGAAGAAGGIAGGYRLPFTAVALVLGLGGPQSATLDLPRDRRRRDARRRRCRDGGRPGERRPRGTFRRLTSPEGSPAPVEHRHGTTRSPWSTRVRLHGPPARARARAVPRSGVLRAAPRRDGRARSHRSIRRLPAFPPISSGSALSGPPAVSSRSATRRSTSRS